MTTDTRIISFVDIPLVRRLTSNGTVLDSEMGLTRDARGPNSLLLSSLLFPRGFYTLVARSDNQPVIGQFRYRPDDTAAHIVYLAPSLDESHEDTVWLHILDAMAAEAGKHGAHSLVAEVEPTSALFETMRTAGFAVYARQKIWRHNPVQLDADDRTVELTEETDHDQVGISSLIAKIMPPILQPVAAPHTEMEGLVYRKQDRVEAYIGISEGKHGVYLLPFMHPDVMSEAADIIATAVAHTERADKVPVYVCVRSYQDWLDDVMLDLNFEAWIEQAVMVKQIAAGIRHPNFTRFALQSSNIKVSTNVKVHAEKIPPYWSLTVDDNQEGSL